MEEEKDLTFSLKPYYGKKEFEEEIKKKDEKDKKVGLFRSIILKFFCLHSWDECERTNIWGESDKYPDAIILTLICKKCGKIKQINL